MIIGIDPGNIESAYCFLEDGIPKQKAKITNFKLLEAIFYEWTMPYVAVIEQISGMGMAVGKDVFETCYWSGRISLAVEVMKREARRIPRRDVKLHLCGSARAKDSNIITALVDRYDPDRVFGKYGKGTKKNPGPLDGFAKDTWQALAVAVTYLDKKNLGEI